MSRPYHCVVQMPKDARVLNMSAGEDPFGPSAERPWAIGRYNERRPGIYSQELFAGARDIHMGIDLFGPEGTPIHSFDDGALHLAAYNPAAGDYGHVLIVSYQLEGRPLYALYGHLSAASTRGRAPGQTVRRGEVIGWMGDRSENGGWPSHLHFQLSWEKPLVCDLPGVVSQEDHAEALKRFPDPRLVLGDLY